MVSFRPLVRALFLLLLGVLPPLPVPVEARARVPSRNGDEGFTLEAEDFTHGEGGAITVLVHWPRAQPPPERVVVERAPSPEGPFRPVGTLSPGTWRFTDRAGIRDGTAYYYRARAVFSTGPERLTPVCGPARSEGRWFKQGALVTCLLSALVIGAVLFYLLRAWRGGDLYIRPIPGLKAVEEAVGRATEMGRPILYCSGVADLRCPGVLASLTVLSWVAEKVAAYGATLTYPVNNALNLTAGQEIVKEGFLRAGRPELYHDDMVYFISGEQFAYAASVCGLMERERTAANLFFGSFWSESLILTESGAATGAMQIAATDTEHQIPFMVATCDYVIIGEEFYAASAYLSRDRVLKGSLKAQDVVKAVLVLLILAGVVLTTLHELAGVKVDWFFRLWEL